MGHSPLYRSAYGAFISNHPEHNRPGGKARAARACAKEQLPKDATNSVRIMPLSIRLEVKTNAMRIGRAKKSGDS
jgi:hypothetical protein